MELLALAVAPGAAIMLYIYLKDKHEREPLGLLMTSFALGVFSAFITLALTEIVNLLVATKEPDEVSTFVDAFFKVAFIEEFSKFIFVRFVLYPNKNFNEPYDGIIYAVMVSMGFATLENILYVYQSGWVTGIIRMFTAVPAHATFAIMMGYFLGKAKFTHSRMLYFSLVGLLTAAFFHGTYDYFLMIGEVKKEWTGVWVFAFISLIVGLVLSRHAIRLHQKDSPFISQKTPAEQQPGPSENQDINLP